MQILFLFAFSHFHMMVVEYYAITLVQLDISYPNTFGPQNCEFGITDVNSPVAQTKSMYTEQQLHKQPNLTALYKLIMRK